MIKSNVILCFDFETSGFSSEDDEPVQIASVAIDPEKLEIIPGSEFNSLMKPVNILSGTEAEIRTKWNKSAKAWEANKKTRKELENAPLPEHVWKAFADYVKGYNVAGWGGKPIPAGQNIQGFDLLFVDSLCRRYKMSDKSGKQQLFNTSIILDTLNFCYGWLNDLPDHPDSFSMDNLRPWLGISTEGSHDALNDTLATSRLLISFLKIQKHYAPKVKFKSAFAAK